MKGVVEFFFLKVRYIQIKLKIVCCSFNCINVRSVLEKLSVDCWPWDQDFGKNLSSNKKQLWHFEVHWLTFESVPKSLKIDPYHHQPHGGQHRSMMDRGLYKMGGRLPVTTYYRTMSIDNKPTTVIIGPSKYNNLHTLIFPCLLILK